MWFSLGDRKFIGKKIMRDDCFCVFVTDFKSIWYKYLSDSELLSTSQKFNPLFEAPPDKLKEITMSLFDDDRGIRKVKENENHNIELELESIKMSIKFQFRITLIKGNEELLYNELTLPLLLTLIQMQRREDKLIRIINEKDSEIEEWKQMNKHIPTDFISTKPFNEKEFRDEDASSPISTNIKWQPMELLNCINFLQDSLTCTKNIKSLNFNKKSEDSSNANQLQVAEKCTSDTKGLKQSININHQIIKKRKKQNKIV